MDFIRKSWKAVVALIGTTLVPSLIDQLPAIEAWLNGWASKLIAGLIVAAGVWLKRNFQS